jgi:hypothetical protein
MPAHSYLRCERRPTGALSVHERHELLSFAAELEPALDPAYLAPRLASYEEAWIVRRGQRVAGFLLLQTYATEEAELVYIGPAFSRGGAYAFAFAELLSALLSRAEPFVIAMEVENPSVWRMLERLLPSHVFPRAAAAAELPEARRAQAARLLMRVPHVVDFDPDSMTSAVANAPSVRGAAARYAVLLVPCDGSLRERASVARELRGGLRTLRTPVSRIGETRDG